MIPSNLEIVHAALENRLILVAGDVLVQVLAAALLMAHLAEDTAIRGKILAERLNISPQQLRYVDNSEPGEGLLIYENVILTFRNPIPQRSQLYKIMTTRLGEGETV